MSDISNDISTMIEPKKNERLDNVIEMFKDHNEFVQSSDEDEDQKRIWNTSKIDQRSSFNKILSGDNVLTNSYLMWKNTANVCWLDASMALLVHNRTLIQSVNESSTAQVANIIQHYYKAVSILNYYSDSKLIEERVKDAKDMLKTVQESALRYLQPILKYKEGEPDSAFCSLLNLIVEDKSVKGFFELEYTWVQVCQECNTHRAKKHRKSIITLPKVEGFQPGSPISLYQCLVCKASDQRMTLIFRTLPQCLLFHFESGAGKGELQFSSFNVGERTYKMTGVMTHEKGKESNSNHFVTFIRDPPSDMWMECNDLCEDITCFNVVPPFIDLQDVYILMFEAMDGSGTVPNHTSTDKCVLEEELASESVDIPFIDLEDESEEDNSETGIKEDRESEENKNMVGKEDLFGVDSEEGSGKDTLENTCLVGNVFCENTNSVGKDAVGVSSNSNFEDVDLFGTDCGDDPTKERSENVELFKTVYEDGSNKYKFKTGGLFEKFHLSCKDNSCQVFPEVYHGGSMGDAGNDTTMAGCVSKPQSESKDAFLNELSSSSEIVVNRGVNAPSQLQINNMENTSLQPECKNKLTASVSLDKDIFTTENNLKSLDEMAHSPKDIQPDADNAFIDTRGTDSSDNSKTSKNVKKKLVGKKKPVSHHQKTLLGSKKATNETLENFLVSERSDNHAPGMQIDKIDNISLEAAYRNASKTLTESKSKISVAGQRKVKPLFKIRKHKPEDSSKVENNSTKIDDNLQDNAIKKSCIASEITSESLQKLSEMKKKTFGDQARKKDLKTTNNRPRKQLIETSERSLLNEIGKQIMGKNLKTYGNRSNKQVIAKQRKPQTFLKNRKLKSVDNSIIISDVKSIENVRKLENLFVTEEQLQIQSDYPSSNLNVSFQLGEIKASSSLSFSENENFENPDQNEHPRKTGLINSSDPFDVTLIAKENKAKSLLQNRNRLKEITISTKTNVAFQETGFDSTSIETTNESVNSLQTGGVIGKNKKGKKSQSKTKTPVDFNLSNDPSNMPSAVKQSKAKPTLKNRKRKCVDSFKSEVSTKMDDVLQENIPSNLNLGNSPKDVPLKETRYQLGYVNPVAQHQNGTASETVINETSNCNDNDQSDKCPSRDTTNSKVKEPLPSNSVDSSHGPACICDGTRITDDLISMIAENVIKGVFSF